METERETGNGKWEREFAILNLDVIDWFISLVIWSQGEAVEEWK